MARRTRHWLVTTLSAALGGTLGLVSRAAEWSDTTAYAVGAGLIALVVLTAGLWVELAPEGTGRRKTRG
jgi:hypothetical protein